MKKLYIVLATVLLTVSSFAQSPEKMSYQAVIRDANNMLLQDKTVSMKLSILQGNIAGTAIYIETQSLTTNSNGLISLEIGTGSVVVGSFSAIDWSAGPYFIKTETDPLGGFDYTITGVSQLLSVPYALYAKTSGSSIPGPAGKDGVDGSVGPQGSAGKDGVDGSVGPQGPAGKDGVDGSVGPQGPAGKDGVDGSVGPQGPAGKDGVDGAVGPQGPAGGELKITTVSSSTTLSTESQFVIANGTVTITLPATPSTGQVIYVFTDTPTSVSLNPNGKLFRQSGADYGTSKVSEFGTTAANALSIVFSGTKWYALSIK